MAIQERLLKKKVRLKDGTDDQNEYTIQVYKGANNQQMYNFARAVGSILVDADGEAAGLSETVKIEETELSQGF